VIAEQDLVPVNAEREAFIETRAQEVDLPLRFTVVYQDLERGADVGTQDAKRVAGPSSAMHSQNEAIFDLPLTLTAGEAKGIALRQLHSGWLERTGYEWRLPWTHVDLKPADVVQVALDDGALLNLRLLETELGANLELAWKTVLEEKSSYAAVPVTQGGIGYRRVSEVYGSEAWLFVLRGRRGTEVCVAGHEPGEMFVMLGDGAATLQPAVEPEQVPGEAPAVVVEDVAALLAADDRPGGPAQGVGLDGDPVSGLDRRVIG
jgi:hypothetical protein